MRTRKKPNSAVECSVVKQSPEVTAEETRPYPVDPGSVIADASEDQLLGSGEDMEIQEPTVARTGVGACTFKLPLYTASPAKNG